MKITDTKIDSYLQYLLTLPETRLNQALIDCAIQLIVENPDTQEALDARN